MRNLYNYLFIKSRITLLNSSGSSRTSQWDAPGIHNLLFKRGMSSEYHKAWRGESEKVKWFEMLSNWPQKAIKKKLPKFNKLPEKTAPEWERHWLIFNLTASTSCAYDIGSSGKTYVHASEPEVHRVIPIHTFSIVNLLGFQKVILEYYIGNLEGWRFHLVYIWLLV